MKPERILGFVEQFVKITTKNKVRLILVGGAAVNFHGFQRNSEDIDFWIDTSSENMKRFQSTLRQMGYKFSDFPEKVRKGKQNITIKFGPTRIEILVRYDLNKTFEQAYQNCQKVQIKGHDLKYHVLGYDDLIASKFKSGRKQDLLDIETLQKIKKTSDKQKKSAD